MKVSKSFIPKWTPLDITIRLETEKEYNQLIALLKYSTGYEAGIRDFRDKLLREIEND